MAEKSLEEHLREQGDLIDRRLADGFREQAELIERLLVDRTEELDRRWDARLKPIRVDLSLIKHAVGVILTRLT